MAVVAVARVGTRATGSAADEIVLLATALSAIAWLRGAVHYRLV